MPIRPNIQYLRARALQNPEVKAEYDALAPTFEIKRRMLAMRQAAGVTQEQMAERLGPRKAIFPGLKA
jgi:hypothetical protein